MKQKMFVPENETSYTFEDYSELRIEFDEILKGFGYNSDQSYIDFPRPDIQIQNSSALKEQMIKGIQSVSLTSEASKREFLVSPVLWQVINYIPVRIRLGYSLNISNALQGAIDYYIESADKVLILQMKQGDMQKNFNQLVAQMIALDQWMAESPEPSSIYGAVSMGEVWQFGVLDRQNKFFTKDIAIHTLPNDVDQLLQILIGSLTRSPFEVLETSDRTSDNNHDEPPEFWNGDME